MWVTTRGKDVTLAVGDITNSGATYPVVSMYLYDSDFVSNSVYLGAASASNPETVIHIPETARSDQMLMAVLFIASSTSCAEGAYVIFDRLRAEIGGSVFSWPTPLYQIADLRVVGCASRVNVMRAVISTTVEVRNSEVVFSRSAFYGSLGVLAYMARVVLSRNRGTCTQVVKAVCSQVYVTGIAPGGTYNGWQIDTTTASILSDGTAPTEATKTINAYATGMYTTYWWSSWRAMKQGYTANYGRWRGGMWFDLSGIPTGATVTGMRLTLKRAAGYGIGDVVTVKVYGTSSNARDGQPALSSGGYVLGTIGPGKTKTYDLPAALVTGLADGTYKGLVLYADDTHVLSGHDYSVNYAVIEGTDGVVPKLAVTYTT